MSISEASTPTSLELYFPEPVDEGISYGGSRALFREAALQFGVELTPEEDYDWLVVLGACMLIDHLVDVEASDIAGGFADVVAGNLRDDLNQDLQIRTYNYMQRQPQDERDSISEKAAEVSRLATEQRTATSADEIIAIRMAESTILTSLLALDIGDGNDAHSREAFNSWLESWSNVGYLLDSFMDITDDFENHESGLKPSAKARLKLGVAACKETTLAIRKTPPKLLGKCALNGFKYVVKGKRVEIVSETIDSQAVPAHEG